MFQSCQKWMFQSSVVPSRRGRLVGPSRGVDDSVAKGVEKGVGVTESSSPKGLIRKGGAKGVEKGVAKGVQNAIQNAGEKGLGVPIRHLAVRPSLTLVGLVQRLENARTPKI